MTDVAVLVPWRPSDPIREDRWKFVRRWWADAGYLVIPADDGGAPFSRGCSANLAAQHVDADVLIIADADTITPLPQVEEAVRLAHQQPGMVVAHDRWCYLTVWATKQYMDGDDRWRRHIEFTLDNTVSSCVVLSRETWDTVGGFDPRFRAWGNEDTAFSLATAALCGPIRWVHGDTMHLWHPKEPIRPAENTELVNEYFAVRDDPDGMRALIDRAHSTVAA